MIRDRKKNSIWTESPPAVVVPPPKVSVRRGRRSIKVAAALERLRQERPVIDIPRESYTDEPAPPKQVTAHIKKYVPVAFPRRCLCCGLFEHEVEHVS